MFMMAMVLFAYISASMILPLKVSWKYKIPMLLAIFCIAQKNGILRRLGGGMFFAPELPRCMLIAVAFLYGILFFASAFLLFKDIIILPVWKILEYKKVLKRKLPHGIIVCVILGISVLFSGYSLYEGLLTPPVKYVDMKFSNLPTEFDGFKIAVLADLHASAVNQSPFIERIIDLTLAEKPDLIVLPGDIIDGRVDKRMEDIEPLKKLSAPYGVYAALGNHEYYSGYEEWLAKFAELKLPMLINANVEIKKDGKSIYVGGIADHAAYRHKKELPDLQKTWQNVPVDSFKILLSHQPKNLRKNARSGVALQISGHTHGGMIIGMNKLLIAPSNEGVVCGEYDIDGMKLYISAGASLWSGFPLRLGVPPEISIIRLFRK
ncbi:MAG: metallophosphoesterase [Lentisphaeria bacterium]|nr:metallophosphoesterase [Lentisphaeria bacterium]